MIQGFAYWLTGFAVVVLVIYALRKHVWPYPRRAVAFDIGFIVWSLLMIPAGPLWKSLVYVFIFFCVSHQLGIDIKKKKELDAQDHS